MQPFRLVTCATLGIALSGCVSMPATRAVDAPQAATRTDSALGVQRSQKPDVDAPRKPSNSLELVNDQFAKAGQVTAHIRAHVNGVPILDEEVREACYPYLMATLNLPEPERSARQAEVFNRELNSIIDREVILKEAFDRIAKMKPTVMQKLKEAAGKEFDRQLKSLKDRAKVKSDEELKVLLQSQGMSLAGYRRHVERNFMAMEYMRGRVFPYVERISHDDLWQYFQQHSSDFVNVDKVQWQDIFIDASKYPTRQAAQALARQLVAQAQAGVDFAQLVKQYDNGDSSWRGGEGNGQRQGEIQPREAEPLLFKMKDGEVGPVIELSTGFHVIRLIKRDYAGPMPFDDKVQALIRKKLSGEIFEREFKRLLGELRRKSTIEVVASQP
jgi:parvulin-like peptidyl-prolyl isomerase